MAVPGRGVPWAEANELVRDIARRIAPTVERLEVAGSVRRRVSIVGDLELVAVPSQAQDLFGPVGVDLERLEAVLASRGRRVKGGARYVRYMLERGRGRKIALDLFLVHPPAQWGSIFAIRTGPKELGQHCVTVLKNHGLFHSRGRVLDAATGDVRPTPTEEEFFRLCGVAFVPPEERGELARRLGLLRRS